MTANSIRAEVEARGGELSVEGNRLKVRIARGHLTDELRKKLVQHEAEVLALLKNPNTCDPQPELYLFAREGKPIGSLQPCPRCHSRQFVWLVGNDFFSCKRCDPPDSSQAIAAYVTAPFDIGDQG